MYVLEKLRREYANVMRESHTAPQDVWMRHKRLGVRLCAPLSREESPVEVSMCPRLEMGGAL